MEPENQWLEDESSLWNLKINGWKMKVSKTKTGDFSGSMSVFGGYNLGVCSPQE